MKRPVGRPRLENDADDIPRDQYEQGERLRRANPGYTRAQIAAHLSLTERQYKTLVSRFRKVPPVPDAPRRELPDQMTDVRRTPEGDLKRRMQEVEALARQNARRV
jgi:hypothetical protein